MILTKEQEELKNMIDLARQDCSISAQRFQYFLSLCQHIYEKSGESAKCMACQTCIGWWCDKAPKNICEYADGSEECNWCGSPGERK